MKNKNMWIWILIIMLVVTLTSSITIHYKNKKIVDDALSAKEDFTKLDFQYGDLKITLDSMEAEELLKPSQIEAIKNLDDNITILEKDRDLYKSSLISLVKYTLFLIGILDRNHIMYPEYGIDIPLQGYEIR